MAFKLHARLNRVTELERTLGNLAGQIADHVREAHMHRTCARLCQIEYLTLEMEYGTLTGERIDNSGLIEQLKAQKEKNGDYEV